MRRTHVLIALVIPALAGWVPRDVIESPRHPVGEAAGVEDDIHSVRISIANLDVAETVVKLQVRFFWDDLQIAVMEATDDMQFELAETPEVDLVIEKYLNDMLVLQVGEDRLVGSVTQRGIEPAARRDEVMWWYRLEYPVSAPPERLYVKNRLLFNMFEDQRNIMHVVTASGRERAYYFSWDEEDVTVPLS